MNVKKVTVLLAALVIMSLAFAACGTGAEPSYPINPTVLTTLDRIIEAVPVPASSPAIFPYELSKYPEYGYGVWQYGDGLSADVRLDLMPSSYPGMPVGNTKDLLRFFTITDIHLTDEESPAQCVTLGFMGGSSAAYSGVMMYTTQVLDAAIQTINAVHNQDKFDFGISLGDTCNSTQYNEQRWYIDILDGKVINPDSGIKDDPIPGPLNDHQDIYQAAGLDKSISWYQTLGNHDHNFTGFLPPNDYIKQSLIGTDIINMGNAFVDPLGQESRGIYMGSLDGSKPFGDVIGAGAVSDYPDGPPQIAAADPNRRSLSVSEWINEFFNTDSNPTGHGFSKANVESGFACYSFEPKANLPVKMIVLDDTQSNEDPIDTTSLGYGHAELDKQRYTWLVKELDRGQADGKLMIIAMHDPIGVEVPPSMMAWSKNSYVTEKKFIAKLHTYPNLILVIAGHRHMNNITEFKSPNPARPELGFWQVETASLRDFPQQFRTFDIVRNFDNTISITALDVDVSIADGSLAAQSRTYAVATDEVFNQPARTPDNSQLLESLGAAAKWSVVTSPANIGSCAVTVDGETVNPAKFTAAFGASVEISGVSAKSGYYLASIKKDGIVADRMSSAFVADTKAHKVVLYFKKNPVITATASPKTKGSISPSGKMSVVYGTNKTFTVSPVSGYAVKSFTIDGNAAPLTNNTYTMGVEKDHKIVVTFTVAPKAAPKAVKRASAPKVKDVRLQLDIADYLPQQVGNTWLYNYSYASGYGKDERETIGETTLFHDNTVTPIDCAYLYPDGSIESWTNYALLADNGLYLYGTLFANEDSTEAANPAETYFDPALLLLPRMVSVGETYTSFTNGLTSSAKIGFGEAVSVPAGTFNDVLKLEVALSGNNAPQGWTWWLARGIGKIKAGGFEADGTSTLLELKYADIDGQTYGYPQ